MEFVHDHNLLVGLERPGRCLVQELLKASLKSIWCMKLFMGSDVGAHEAEEAVYVLVRMPRSQKPQGHTRYFPERRPHRSSPHQRVVLQLFRAIVALYVQVRRAHIQFRLGELREGVCEDLNRSAAVGARQVVTQSRHHGVTMNDHRSGGQPWSWKTPKGF